MKTKKREFKDPFINYADKLAQLEKKATKVCNKYIRMRDPYCITCSSGNPRRTEHAGHFIHKGNRNTLLVAFDEKNVHGQCGYCNTHLHGNHEAYRLILIERYGLAEVERLESAKFVTFRPSVEWFEAIIKYYEEKIKMFGCHEDMDLTEHFHAGGGDQGYKDWF